MSDLYSLFSARHYEMVMRDPELKSPMATVSGELQTATRLDDVSINFQYGPSSYDTFQELEGDGSVDNFKAMARLQIGTGVSRANLVSRESVRYRAGHECLGAFSYIFADPEENVRQLIGFSDDSDGFSFGYEGEAFGVWYIEGGNLTHIPQSQFNVNKVDGTGRPGFNLDPQKMNVYKVSFAWHGGLPAYFSVYAGWEHGWVLCHVIDEINTSIETHLENPNLPVRACVERLSGTGEAKTAYSGSWRAGVLASEKVEGNLSTRRFDYSGFDISIPSGVRTTLLFLKNKDTFQGKKNHIRYESLFLEFITDGNKPVLFESWNVSDGTLSDTITWTDRNTDNSVMQYSTQALTFTPNPAIPFPPRVATVLNKIDSRRDSLRDQGFVMFPGDEILISATSTNTSEVGFALRTFEYF